MAWIYLLNLCLYPTLLVPWEWGPCGCRNLDRIEASSSNLQPAQCTYRSSQRTGSIIRCLVSRHGHDISNPTFLLTSSSAVPLESVTCLGSWPLTLTIQLVTIFCSVYAEPAPGVVLRPPDRPAPAPPPLGQTLQVLSHKLGVTRARESLLIGHWLGYSPLIGQRLAGLWLAIKAVFVLAPIKSFLFSCEDAAQQVLMYLCLCVCLWSSWNSTSF